LGVDSSGFSTKRYETWFSIRDGGCKGRRRSYLKLHILISLASLAILSCRVTKGTKNDSPILAHLLRGIPYGEGDFVADAAYLSRRNCKLVAEKGRTPFIKPKKNTKVNKKGCQAWRDMVESYLADREAFLKRHHKRSRVEGIYSSLKRCFGNHLSSRKRRAQRRELLCRVIVYNIGIVNLSSFTSGGARINLFFSFSRLSTCWCMKLLCCISSSLTTHSSSST
jgi:hypothetical protein